MAALHENIMSFLNALSSEHRASIIDIISHVDEDIILAILSETQTLTSRTRCSSCRIMGHNKSNIRCPISKILTLQNSGSVPLTLQTSGSVISSENIIEIPNITPSSEYILLMKENILREVSLDTANHRLILGIRDFERTPPTKSQIASIYKEFKILSESLPISEHASIVVRISDTHIDTLSFMITGPVDTPYAYGCFIFDMYIPPRYPKVPPKCLLRTTGYGTIRFNPNLYQCGKVCLSLLGTWQGPTWVPNKSTLLQVLISIQSLIFVEEPFYNEPMYHEQYGQIKYQKLSQAYTKKIRSYTVQHAIISHLERLQSGIENYESIFDDALLTHFSLKKDEILANALSWDIDDNTMSRLEECLSML